MKKPIILIITLTVVVISLLLTACRAMPAISEPFRSSKVFEWRSDQGTITCCDGKKYTLHYDYIWVTGRDKYSSWKMKGQEHTKVGRRYVSNSMIILANCFDCTPGRKKLTYHDIYTTSRFISFISNINPFMRKRYYEPYNKTPEFYKERHKIRIKRYADKRKKKYLSTSWETRKWELIRKKAKEKKEWEDAVEENIKEGDLE